MMSWVRPRRVTGISRRSRNEDGLPARSQRLWKRSLVDTITVRYKGLFALGSGHAAFWPTRPRPPSEWRSPMGGSRGNPDPVMFLPPIPDPHGFGPPRPPASLRAHAPLQADPYAPLPHRG